MRSLNRSLCDETRALEYEPFGVETWTYRVSSLTTTVMSQARSSAGTSAGHARAAAARRHSDQGLILARVAGRWARVRADVS
mmetsp:Transcript_24753/g.76342  ORF Transcript_24753/g.76342 Transcript_24753/m.76342 type:complete len:82 (-) Transcript_24753:1795-2040(-)